MGGTLKKGIGERYKTVMMDAMGLAATALGINAIVQAMPASRYRVLFIVSLALGGLIGTKLSLDTTFARAVSKISGGSNLAQGLSTAILLYCAGTLSILGPMESALHGDKMCIRDSLIVMYILLRQCGYARLVAGGGVVRDCDNAEPGAPGCFNRIKSILKDDGFAARRAKRGARLLKDIGAVLAGPHLRTGENPFKKGQELSLIHIYKSDIFRTNYR